MKKKMNNDKKYSKNNLLCKNTKNAKVKKKGIKKRKN